MENNSLEYPEAWLPFCYEAENTLKMLSQNKGLKICILFQTILIWSILIGIPILVYQYIRCKIVLHGNLLVILISIFHINKYIN